MNRDEIQTILPHRDGMLLLDQLDKEGGCGPRAVSGAGRRVVPPGPLPRHPCGARGDPLRDPGPVGGDPDAGGPHRGHHPHVHQHEECAVRAPVLPGDRFETKCRITRAKHPFYFAEGEGYVGDTLCVKAEFSFGITERAVCFQRS